MEYVRSCQMDSGRGRLEAYAIHLVSGLNGSKCPSLYRAIGTFRSADTERHYIAKGEDHN